MKKADRAHQRIHLTFSLRVIENGEFRGFLVDIAKEGIMIMSESPFIEGMPHRLKIKPPSQFDWPGKNAEHPFIEFSATCKWTRTDEDNADFFLSGFEFTEITKEADEILRALIKEFRMR